MSSTGLCSSWNCKEDDDDAADDDADAAADADNEGGGVRERWERKLNKINARETRKKRRRR
jgi:hypothetical protein